MFACWLLVKRVSVRPICFVLDSFFQNVELAIHFGFGFWDGAVPTGHNSAHRQSSTSWPIRTEGL